LTNNTVGPIQWSLSSIRMTPYTTLVHGYHKIGS